MKIRKALVAAAGFGTRFLPVTKTIQKEMLPILNRPTIDYVVTDIVRAGITDITFVVSEHNSQIEDYYTNSQHVIDRLRASGKTKELQAIESIHTQVTFSFIKQNHGKQYGTGVPVLLAKDYLIGEDAFLYFTGDDFIFNQDGTPESVRMIQAFSTTNSRGLITCVQKSDDMLHRYGVMEVTTDNGQKYLKNIVEKPLPGEAPSNLVNISKYILTPDVFPLLQQQKNDVRTNELLITDTLVNLAGSGGQVLVHQPAGTFIDAGNVASWLEANIRLAHVDPVLREHITKTIDNLNA